MRKLDLTCFFIQLIHWKINNPTEFEQVIIDKTLLCSDAHPCLTSKICCLRSWRAGEKHRIAITHAKTLFDLVRFICTQRFRYRASRLTFPKDDIAHTRRTFTLCPAIHAVSDSTAPAFWPGYCANHSAFINIFRENRKIRVAENICYIANFKRNTQIRLITTIFEHSFIKWDMHKIWINFLVGELFKHAFDHRFYSSKHICLFNKAHFQIKLIKLAGAAVSAAIFITETRRNLKIFIKARNHDQLLKLLRCLWQGIKFTRMQPSRHKEITRTFRRRSRKDRCLKFCKA